MSRFTRQIRLAEVGREGQTRLEAATVGLTPGPDLARTIEERYLVGAGLRVDPTRTEAWTVPDLGLRHAAPRDVAAGAYAALLSIKRALG